MPDLCEEPWDCVPALPYLSKAWRFPTLDCLTCRGTSRIPTKMTVLLGGANEAMDGKELCKFFFFYFYFIIFFNFYFFISWRLITLQYCSEFCHTLTWISHGFTCVPHPNPPSHLPLHPIPLGLPSAPGLSTCLMHPTWAGDLFHPR